MFPELTKGVEVFIARQIVANYIVSLPASKQGETWSDLHFHRVIQNLQMGGGDVANLIPVVNVLSRGRKDGLWRRKDGGRRVEKTQTLLILFLYEL